MQRSGELPLVSGVPVTLEIGKRRTFAQAVGWPGWCRAGKGEDLALANLLDYADRYRSAVGELADPLGAGPPAITVIERVDGDATTDFGAPGKTVPSDRRSLRLGEPRTSGRVPGCVLGGIRSVLSAGSGS